MTVRYRVKSDFIGSAIYQQVKSQNEIHPNLILPKIPESIEQTSELPAISPLEIKPVITPVTTPRARVPSSSNFSVPGSPKTSPLMSPRRRRSSPRIHPPAPMNGPVVTSNESDSTKKYSSVIVPPMPACIPPPPPISAPSQRKPRTRPSCPPPPIPPSDLSVPSPSVPVVPISTPQVPDVTSTPAQPIKPSQSIEPIEPIKPSQSIIPSQSIKPTLPIESTQSIKPSQPEKTNLDDRETLYTFFSTSDSGSFPIYASTDDSLWGRGTFKNGERNGPWVQYYHSNPEHIRRREYYVDGEKHGDFFHYYDNDVHSLHTSVSYEHGKKDGYFYEYQKNGQLLLSVYYEQGVEKKRVEFFESGYMKRIVFRKRHNSLATIEFRPNGQILYIGESKREKRGGSYHYVCHGMGTYYYDLFAELPGEFRCGCFLWKGKEISVVDCLSVVKKSQKGGFYIKELPDGTILPWKLISSKVNEDGSISAILGGKERVIKTCSVVSDDGGEYTERCVLSILGYPVVLTLSRASSMKRIEFYPFFTEKDDVCVSGLKMSAVVEGAIVDRAACSVKTYSKSKLVSQINYLNTGERPLPV